MIQNFDMNLFVVLHTLLEERSVTRTGERLGRTQSAISNSLRRLRDAFDDPLFIRTPTGLVPTVRAEELGHTVTKIIELTEGAIQPERDFDPTISKSSFVLGAPDRLSLPVLLPFLEKLRKTAPGINVDLRTTDPDFSVRLITEGTVDLALGWFDELPPYISRQHVFSEPLVCLCRDDHPILSRVDAKQIDAILSYSHLLVSSGGGRKAAFDRLLAQKGLARHTAATLSNFTMVPELLRGSDLIGVFTKRTTEFLAERYPLVTVSLPKSFGALSDDLIWHRRFDTNKRHKWFRKQLLLSC